MGERIGKLRFPLVLLKQVDKAGGQTTSKLVKEYVTIANRRGNITPFKGAHGFQDKNTSRALTHTILIRHEVQFDSRRKVTHVFHAIDDIVYEIQEVLTVKQRNRFLNYRCVARGPSANFTIV